MIEVKQTGQGDPLEFDVTIGDAADRTHHRVSLSQADHRRLTGGTCPPERSIEAVFRFLLDREPKEAILARFDVAIVSRYFPEFEAALPDYLRQCGC